MENTAQTPQGQPQAEGAGIDRLEREFGGAPAPETTTEVPEKTAHDGFQDTERPAETPEAVKPEEKPVEKPEEKPETEKPVEFEFKDQTQEEDGWRPYFNEFGLEVPQDYSEEKGFDLFKSKLEEKYNQEKEQIKSFKIDDILSEFPEDRRGEAKLVLDLLQSGHSLDQINEPILNIQKLKSLTPEQLVRANYERLEGWTEEMVDHKMQQLSETKQLDIEHKIMMDYLNNQEKSLTGQRQKFLQDYQSQQQAIKDQKKQKELSDFKAALDRETVFLDTKLSSSNKGTVLQEFQNGYKERLLNDPVKLAKFMLFDKYGEQGLKFLESRAMEKARIEVAKKQHNVPQDLAPRGGGRATNQNQYKSGIERLEAESAINKT